MGNKEIETTKKEVKKEIKTFASKTKKDVEKAKQLKKEEVELAKKKSPGPDDKKRTFDIRKSLKDLEKSYLKEADSASARINKMLKVHIPDDKKQLPEWQKGMDKWYRDLLEKESGFDVGHGMKLTGDISVKEKKAMIILKGKF